MNARHPAKQRRANRAGVSLRLLDVATAILGLLATGCVKDHDPRNDSSVGDHRQFVTRELQRPLSA